MTTFELRLREALHGTFDFERELGGGGMSRVFVAVERSLGRKIVIKVLSPDLTADVNRGRFRREIQVAAQLQHPHIVPLLAAGEVDDVLYYTMPFITGESLKSAIEKYGPLPVVEVVRILYHVSEALEYAHGEGVVHRDIKPANILRSGSYSMITDFGVAKALNAAMPTQGMTSTGMAVGTPAYMAPEQLAGDSAADHRIDIYALGLLAYELLNGKSPFAASSPQRVLAAVLTQEPKPLIEVRPDVPPSLSELVMRCLSKEPEKRPASAREVLDSLDMFSTASGEIRTMEHRLPRSQRITPTAVPVARTPTSVPVVESPTVEPVADTPTFEATPRVPTEELPVVPALEETIAIPVKTPQEELHSLETAPAHGNHAGYYDRPQKGRSKMVAGVIALLVPVAAGAFLLSQRQGNEPATAPADSVAIGAPININGDSTLPQQVAAAPRTDSSLMAAPVVVDSQRIVDSVKKARRDAARKAAIADSLKKAREAQQAQQVRQSAVSIARTAASSMLADPRARKAFNDGATHKGGLLGAKRKGDLQTQIDALQPFLSRSGVTYEEFKSLVKEAGINLFDEFGRMIPSALQQFASGG